MKTAYSLKWPRIWHILLVVVASLIVLSTTQSFAWAAPQTQPARYAALSTQQAPADDPIPAPPSVGSGRFRYFSQTAHFLRGAFLNYWESHGATPVFGLPITEAVEEDGLVVQYLERARLEWHPELANDPRNQILLTRLGAIMTEARGLVFDYLPAGDTTANSFFFAETGHNLANAFLSYWQRNGGLAVFGYPISEELVETNPADGQQYTVQYFERNRFEWHPENPPAFNVQLGLLGVEYARMVALNPLARILLPGPSQGGDEDLSDSPQLAKLVDDGLLPAVQALGRTPQFRWIPSVLIQNNIAVEFGGLDEEGVAGSLIITRSRTRPYIIVIPESERDESLQALASVLAHEATHAYDLTSGLISNRTRCSIEEELRAYMNGLAAWILLQGSDALSQAYTPQSLDASVNNSVRGFNAGKPQLDFDFSPLQGRKYLKTLYGESCGQ